MAPVRSKLALGKTLCVLCLERKSAVMKCPHCAGVACVACAKTYFTTSDTDKCYACAEITSFIEIRKVLGNASFRSGYMGNRGRIALDGARGDMRVLAAKRRTPEQLFACAAPICSGFVVVDADDADLYYCDVCAAVACIHCRQMLGKPSRHVCHEDDIATVHVLAKKEQQSKPCPGCAEPIVKEKFTCDQMYCVLCKTTFNWKTLAISGPGVYIHNPEYTDRLRSLGLLTRISSSVSERLINMDIIPLSVLIPSVVSVHYVVTDISRLLPDYENASDYGNTKDLHPKIASIVTSDDAQAIGRILAKRELDARIRKVVHDALSDAVIAFVDELHRLCDDVSTMSYDSLSIADDFLPVQFLPASTFGSDVYRAIKARLEPYELATTWIIDALNKTVDECRTLFNRKELPKVYFTPGDNYHPYASTFVVDNPRQRRDLDSLVFNMQATRKALYNQMKPAFLERARRSTLTPVVSIPPRNRDDDLIHEALLNNLIDYLHREQMLVDKEATIQRELTRLHRVQWVSGQLHRLQMFAQELRAEMGEVPRIEQAVWIEIHVGQLRDRISEETSLATIEYGVMKRLKEQLDRVLVELDKDLKIMRKRIEEQPDNAEPIVIWDD
jgi:hypothetical protein